MMNWLVKPTVQKSQCDHYLHSMVLLHLTVLGTSGYMLELDRLAGAFWHKQEEGLCYCKYTGVQPQSPHMTEAVAAHSSC